jgi:serine phosphatase RsbU (regulator of sigma subunit)
VPFLEFQTGPRSGERFTLDRERTLIGRHPDCDLVIDAAAVSRQHAAVIVTGGQASIEDLRSRNGTIVNRRLVSGRTRLEDGDEVWICGHRFRYFLNQPSEPLPDIAGPAAAGDDLLANDDPPSSVIVSQVDVPSSSSDVPVGRQAEVKLRAVLGLNRAIGASLSLDEVLPKMLDGLFGIFPGAERGFVLLKDPQSQRLVLKARRMRSGADPGPLRLSLSLMNHVANSRRAILSADATTDSRFGASESLLDCRIRSVMCVPVTRADGGLLGVVQVDSRDVRDGFTQEDLDVLAGIAGQASQAIEQALAHDERVEREHLNRDLELAHRVQQGLLPSRPPEISGYEMFDFYEAARHVGGDFFAYVPLPGDRLAVVLADVSGKGVAAALLMAALSADVRYCLASEPDLGQAVARINETFLRGGWDDRFATLIVAVLDPAAHRVTLCNAGHLPAFLRGPGGIVRAVAADLGGLPLGMAAGREFRSCTVDLAPGAALVFCTDGISEALDHEDRCYGLERLETVLAEPIEATAGDLGRRILADVERHAAGQVRSDDICLICLRRLETVPPAHPA